MVADDSKMASTITVFKNLQILKQQIKFLNEKYIFLWLLDEYIINELNWWLASICKISED